MRKRSSRLVVIACFLGLMLSMVPLPTRSVSAVAPIRLYVFAGQSNMVGTAARSAEVSATAPRLNVPPPNVMFWGPTTDAPKTWGRIVAPTVIRESMFRNGFGPEVSAAHNLSKMRPGEKIAIFKFAKNATNLYKHWNPGYSSGLYRQMLGALSHARSQLTRQTGSPTVIAGFFWLQGESDTYRHSNADAYGKNLTEFIAALRRDLYTPRLPVVIGRIQDVRLWYPPFKYSQVVRREQYEVAAADPYSTLASSDGLARELLSPMHLNTRGTIDMGLRMATPGRGL